MSADPAPRWHALLIGIDAYRGAAPPLAGCVNDIDAIQRVLIERLAVPVDRIRRYAATLDDGVARPTQVPTQLPTWGALHDALDAIAGDVAAGDRVFVYYSGHGTHRFVPTPDGKRYFREAIVPHDNVVFDPQIQDDREQLVFDWELNAWLARLAATTTAVTVILDCCHSAGTTRSIGAGRPRCMPPLMRRIALGGGARSGGVASTGELPSQPPGMAGVGSVAGCMVVAACLDDEIARESELVGEAPHGELTRALLARLAKVTDAELPALRWAHIWRELVDEVRGRNPYQTPWLSSHIGRAVFCGPPTDGDVGYQVRRAGRGYELDVGTLAGVTPGARIAIYPPLAALPRFAPIGTPSDRALRIGELDVVAAERAKAIAEPVAGRAPPDPLVPGARGRLVAAGPDARLRVSLLPYDRALAARIASPLVEILPAGAIGELELVLCDNGDRELADDVFGPDVRGPQPRSEASAAREHHVLHRIPAAALARPAQPYDEVREAVEHYVAYAAPLRLAKRCIDLPLAVQLRLLDCSRVATPIAPEQADRIALDELAPEAPASYRLRARVPGGPAWDLFTIELENLSDQDLYATVLFCQNSGKVALHASQAVLPGVQVTRSGAAIAVRRSRTRVWTGATKGTPLGVEVPARGARMLDRIVAIATTDGAATLEHLATDKTFSGLGARRGATRSAARPPALWTSAVAILRSTA